MYDSGGGRKSAGSGAQREHLKSMAAEAAEPCQSSPATVRRDGRFAEALGRVEEVCGSEVKRQILSGLLPADLSSVEKEAPTILSAATRGTSAPAGAVPFEADAPKG